MSEENRKSNKQYTGTVPKIKYRNNSSYYTNDQERSRSLSNNLSTTWHHPPETANFIRNSRRNPQSNYFTMDSAMEDHHSIPLQNGGPNYVNSSSLTPNGSAPLSRRDSASSSLKCDNVTKYPDKKQIEDKLSQIREYLQITSSLMTSMKNTDEQLDATDEEEKNNLTKMINDLKDSENKLVHMLYGCADENENSSETSGVVITELSPEIVENGVDALSVNSAGSSKRHEIDLNNLDHQDLDVLREQQLALIKLQQKAENKLRDARQIQERMMAQSQYSNDITPANQKDNKNMSIAEFDVEIQKLEERTKRLAEPRQRNISNPNQDRILNEVECLHNKIVTMRNANNEREQLIEVLDTRDTELRSQQAQLQNKLLELQNKKQQIDQLVTQLQTMDEEEGEGNNMGGQVRKIVTMKDQLKKLKDMLEIVKTTENVMSTNPSAEAQAAAFDICTSAENFLQNEIQKPRLPTNCDSNIVIRYDNDTSNDNTRQKQTNKNSRDSGRDAKSRTTSINANEQQAALQAELKAKKRELEDIMGKHKAGTSNLNHDVGIDSSKSEFSCTSNSNTVNEVFWRPTVSQIQDDASDRFSSDDCDGEEDYPSGNQENPIVAQLPSLRYSPSNAAKIRQDNNSDYAFPTERLPSLTRTPERNLRSSSVATSGYVREQPRSNNEHDKLQKQLHLIKSVCDSMLAQQNNSNSTNNQQSNVHQVRNNLTPSSIYSEPGGRYQSPNPHPLNMVNVINSDLPWMNGHNGPNPQVDMGNYQSWLATNTLQTQSFMLNTLNQCCQMLWLQQRELASLRNAVTSLQDRFDFVHPPHIPPSAPPTPLDHQQQRSSSNQYRPLPNNPKTNQVSAACSLPNLNHYNAPPTSNLANHYNAPPTSNLTNHYNGPPTSSNLTNHFNAPPPQTFNASNLANHYNSNVDLTYANQQQLNNAISSNMSEHGSNNLHGLNNNVGQATQSVPAQIWNGPALNNQVAPGNRANNYWDNFRSYSRQNLLSTKNTEGFHNQPSNSVDRSNVSSDHRTNPFTLMSFSKSNSEQDSASTSQENTPQRRRVPFKTPRHIENVPIPPPDVLNVNQNPIIKTERGSSNTTAESDIIDDDNNVSSLGYHVTSLNLNAICDAAQGSGGGSSGAEGGGYKEKEQRRRNEWNGEGQEGRQQKSKLFDELRDNVYKEVASLISANEARPHFLIQLFRDLQMIGSDSLRLKILQSIQSVVTHSLISTQSSNRQSFESQQSRDSDPLSLQENFSLQSTVWSKPMKTFLTGTRNIINMENDEMDVQNAFREIIPMLNDNEDEVVTNQFLISLKQMFLESESFKETVKDTIFQKHFSNVLDEVLEQYCGKKVRDVKLHLIQTVGDLLRGELSFIQLIQETNPENCEPTSNAAHHYSSHASSNLFDTPPFGSGGNIGGANMGGVMGAGGVIVNMAGGMGVAIVGQPGVSLASSQVSGETINNIQNGDLAEADQLGRGVGAVEELDEEEEEGAVGGVLEAPMEDEMDHPISQGNSEEILNLPSIDFPCNAEGLDQVPTRLPTKIKSRSTTPTKDRSNSDAETF